MTITHILRKPLITEQSTDQASQGRVSFEVARRATKTQIKQAIEKIFKVTVVKINTTAFPRKTRRRGKYPGRPKPNGKKAIVTLKSGDKIDLFDSKQK